MSRPWIIDESLSLLTASIRYKLTELDKLVSALPAGTEITINRKLHDQLLNAYRQLPHYPGDDRHAVGMVYRGARLVI